MNKVVLDPKKIRKTILDMAYYGATVHIPCAFSVVELFTVLYNKFVKMKSVDDPDRDYIVLSKGHGVMAQYACLNHLGFLDDNLIKNYFKDGSALKGLADAHIPGIEVTSGSLGHGLSVGVGIALGLKLNGSKQKVYAIVGDGECNEGAIWEAFLFAAQWKLENLCVIIDANGFQAMGKTDEIMKVNYEEKLRAFGFDVLTADGHSTEKLTSTLESLESSRNQKPKALVATTVKGKGVSFMEHNNSWHYTRLTQDDFKKAVNELGFGV